MAALLATLVVAFVAFLVGRSTLPLCVGRCAEPPRHILQLELLLGNALLSLMGLALAEGGRFCLPWLGGTALAVCVVAISLRRWRGDAGAGSYRAVDAAGV